MTTRTAATASLSSFGTSTSSSSSCVFDHANRPTKAEARAVRPRAVSCEVVGPGWVDVCCLSNRVSSQFILFIISEEWSASSVCTQPAAPRVGRLCVTCGCAPHWTQMISDFVLPQNKRNIGIAYRQIRSIYRTVCDLTEYALDLSSFLRRHPQTTRHASRAGHVLPAGRDSCR